MTLKRSLRAPALCDSLHMTSNAWSFGEKKMNSKHTLFFLFSFPFLSPFSFPSLWVFLAQRALEGYKQRDKPKPDPTPHRQPYTLLGTLLPCPSSRSSPPARPGVVFFSSRRN